MCQVAYDIVPHCYSFFVCFAKSNSHSYLPSGCNHPLIAIHFIHTLLQNSTILFSISVGHGGGGGGSNYCLIFYKLAYTCAVPSPVNPLC